MPARFLISLTVTLAALAVAVPASSRTDLSAATTISGTVTLQAVDVTQRCAFTRGSLTKTVIRKVRKAVFRTVNGKRKRVFIIVRRRVPVTMPLLNARCGQAGSFQGQPAVAGAAYNWLWGLEMKNNVTTGFAAETGELGLNFGSPGILTLTMKGRQVPIGTPTAASAQGESKGTWTVKVGTGSYAGATGSGTYVFSTSRNSPTTFEVARIQLEGTLN